MLRTSWLPAMLVLLLSACASLQPVDDDTTTLQEQIRSGELVDAGDRVRITTRDGTDHVIVVGTVDERYVHGHRESRHDDLPQAMPGSETAVTAVAIEHIVRLEAADAVDGTATGDIDNVLFVIAVGVLMIIAAFATF